MLGICFGFNRSIALVMIYPLPTNLPTNRAKVLGLVHSTPFCYAEGVFIGRIEGKRGQNDTERIRKQGSGGRCEIRTHEGLAPLPVFKTGALNRSANLPARDRQVQVPVGA